MSWGGYKLPLGTFSAPRPLDFLPSWGSPNPGLFNSSHLY